jgi:hypothetical protein
MGLLSSHLGGGLWRNMTIPWKYQGENRDDRHTGYAGSGGAGIELVLSDSYFS